MLNTALPNAGLGRRLLSLAYESLIVLAVLLIGDLLLLLAVNAAQEPQHRHWVQVYLVALVGTYFISFWCAGGQTLPMKTWRIRLVRHDGGPVTPRQALIRYIVALASLLVPSLLWALVDRDRQFLHDRLAGTRIVQLTRGT